MRHFEHDLAAGEFDPVREAPQFLLELLRPPRLRLGLATDLQQLVAEGSDAAHGVQEGRDMGAPSRLEGVQSGFVGG